jgi:hypothetical protein
MLDLIEISNKEVIGLMLLSFTLGALLFYVWMEPYTRVADLPVHNDTPWERWIEVCESGGGVYLRECNARDTTVYMDRIIDTFHIDDLMEAKLFAQRYEDKIDARF